MPRGPGTERPQWAPEGRPRQRCPPRVSAALALGSSGMRSLFGSQALAEAGVLKHIQAALFCGPSRA